VECVEIVHQVVDVFEGGVVYGFFIRSAGAEAIISAKLRGVFLEETDIISVWNVEEVENVGYREYRFEVSIESNFGISQWGVFNLGMLVVQETEGSGFVFYDVVLGNGMTCYENALRMGI